MDALSMEQMAVDVEVAVRYQVHQQDIVTLYRTIGGHEAVEAAVLNAIRTGVRAVAESPPVCLGYARHLP